MEQRYSLWRIQAQLAVGFGLSTPEHIAEVTSYADGTVIGSALINLIDRHEENVQAEASGSILAVSLHEKRVSSQTA